jgi:hypothetical protein
MNTKYFVENRSQSYDFFGCGIEGLLPGMKFVPEFEGFNQGMKFDTKFACMQT